MCTQPERASPSPPCPQAPPPAGPHSLTYPHPQLGSAPVSRCPSVAVPVSRYHMLHPASSDTPAEQSPASASAACQAKGATGLAWPGAALPCLPSLPLQPPRPSGVLARVSNSSSSSSRLHQAACVSSRSSVSCGIRSLPARRWLPRPARRGRTPPQTAPCRRPAGRGAPPATSPRTQTAATRRAAPSAW